MDIVVAVIMVAVAVLFVYAALDATKHPQYPPALATERLECTTKRLVLLRSARRCRLLSLYPANSLFANGYLTTPGQEANETHQIIADLGFEIEDCLPN